MPLLRRLPAWTDWIWDRPGVIRRLAAGSIGTDPRELGALAVSMLQGEHGHQRKEVQKLLAWLRTEPRPDVIVLPNSMLIALALPLREALHAPVCCTLQGEDLFIDALPQPYRDQALSLVRKRVADVTAFIAISAYYASFMKDYLGIRADRMRTVRLGVDIDGVDHAPRARHDPFTIGYFARIAPEKGLHVLCETYRVLRREMGLPASRLRAAGYLGARAPGIPGRHHHAAREVGPVPRVRVRRRTGCRRGSSPSCAASTSSRCRPPTRSQRRCSCSRRSPAEPRWCSRASGRFPRSSRRPGADCWWRVPIPTIGG